MNEHVPEWLAGPLSEKALIKLTSTDRELDVPLVLYLTNGPFEQYPKGTITFFEVLSNPADMTPARAYVIKITGERHHVIQPFVGIVEGCIVVGRWADQSETPAPIPLSAVEVVWVACGWIRWNDALDGTKLRTGNHEQA